MKNFLIILVLAFALLAECLAVPMSVNETFMKTFGTVDVDGVGPIHIVSYSTDNLKVHDNGFTLSGGGRIYFSTGGEIGDPLAYWQTPLLDKVFSYDIDVSNVGCHCNAATYFSKMPVYNSDQELDPTPGGDYYCDANSVNNFCPEYDLYEGNKFTMVSTLHTCDKAPPNHYTNCDRGGCGSNAYYVNPKMMCPEESCTINTSKPYKIVHTHRTASDGTLSTINVRFEQEGRSADFNVCREDYVKEMGYSLDGIVFVASLWGGGGIDMGWLDGMTGCGGECILSGSSVTFSNFALKPI